MTIKGIITGDIVNSTKIAAQWREDMVNAIYSAVSDFAATTTVRVEMYRGDSFQVEVGDIRHVLTVALAIRTKLRAATPSSEKMWDARISIGIGEVTYETTSVVMCDGEAYRLSGRGLDRLGKRRLALSFPLARLNDAMGLVTRFADYIISTMSSKQSAVVNQFLICKRKQKDVAEILGLSQQNLQKLWTTSQGQLILEYIEFFKNIIEQNYTHL